MSALGLILLHLKWARLARALLTFSLLGLLGIGFFPLGDQLAQTLERQFPAWHDDEKPVDGVIVLGGGVDVWSSASWDTLAFNSAGNRFVAMADLARRYPSAKIVFTGGYGAMFGQTLSEADIVERHISELGLQPGRVLFERLSRNTKENAAFTKAMLTPNPGERWLLVTSAWHMPRSMGLFRKAGWKIEAYPVGWISAPGYANATLAIEASGHLAKFDTMVREWIGLIAARLLGQSDALLPGP